MRVCRMELRRRVMDDYVKHKDDKKVAMKVLAEKWPVSALVEIQEKLSVQVSLPTIHRELRRLRISLKKLLRTSERDRPDVVAKRPDVMYNLSSHKSLEVAKLLKAFGDCTLGKDMA